MSHDPLNWRRIFPDLAATDAATLAVLDQARQVELPAGQPLFYGGAPCQNYLLVVEGQVRVQVIGEGGREAVLYRVTAGQSCVLTTCCILSGDAYPAEGFTDGPVRALVLGKVEFDRALEAAPGFRRFVFHNLGQRLAGVIVRMEELAFRPVERRLAAFLLAQGGGDLIPMTHQSIAVELGTAREVVSRHLKRLEAEGLVRLGRSTLEILDRPGLDALAREAV
jgi:CRP/FNR family transcriptional regulator